MEREEFLREMDELPELPPGTLRGPEQLDQLERWDSVSLMSFIALAAERSGVVLAPTQISGCRTVDDLFGRL